MDQLDQQIEQYLNNYVTQALSAQGFASQTEDAKKQTAEKIRSYLNSVVTDTLIDNLTDDQVNQLSGVDFDSEEGEAQVSLMAAQVPGFMFILEKKLQEVVGQIQQTGQIPELES